jgi:hypothetical protein
MSLHRWAIGEEGHTLAPEDFMMIQALVKRGVYLCDLAEQLGVHPRTVRWALARGVSPPAGAPGAGVCWIPIGRSSTSGWLTASGTPW